MVPRIYAVDYLKIVLVACVVIGHSGLGSETGGMYYLVIANTVLRLAVPLFAVASGFFLFGTRRKGRQLTWVRRLLVLYVVWFVIYFFVMHLWDRPLSQNVAEFFLGFYHLWFLLALAVGALLLAYFDRKGPRALAISAIVFGVIGLVMQYLYIAHILPVPLAVIRSGPFFIYPFVVMGYLFAMGTNHPEELPWPLPSRDLLIKMLIAGFVLALVENIVTLVGISRYSLLEFPAGLFLMAPAAFGLVLRMDAPPTTLPLGQMALAIYVMHVIFLYTATQMGWTHPLLPALAGFFIPALLVLVVRHYASKGSWISQIL